MLEQRGRCDSCGTFDWQWDNEGDDAIIEVDTYICFGCERVERERDRVKDDGIQYGHKLGFFPILGDV